MPIVLWCSLILCNVLWAFNPTLAKLIIQEVGPIWTAWIRYFGALLAYLFWVAIHFSFSPKKNKSLHSIFFLKPSVFSDWMGIVLLGTTTFLISPLTQMAGLTSSTAVNNALLVALEPLFTALLGWIFLKDSLNRIHLVSFLIAFFGFAFLSRLISELTWASGVLIFSKGDLALAVATACEAAYSIIARRLMKKHQAPAIFGTGVFIGVILLTLIASLSTGGFPPIQQMSRRALLAALWIGPVGTTLTYLFWIHVLQKGVSIGAMALTLFVQPLVGFFFGSFILHEQMTEWQIFGAVLILMAVLFPEVRFHRIFGKELGKLPQ